MQHPVFGAVRYGSRRTGLEPVVFLLIGHQTFLDLIIVSIILKSSSARTA